MKATKEQKPFIMPDAGSDDRPLYRQIYDRFRKAILRGEIAPEVRLPSTRELARQLGVSRITVVNAYDQLLAEGYLEGRAGAGTFVASELPEELLQTEPTAAERTFAANQSRPRFSAFGERLSGGQSGRTRSERRTEFVPFQNGLTAVDRFPFGVWSKIAAKYHRHPPHDLLGYGDPQGFRPLREAIAGHLAASRGVRCTAEQVIVTSGAQQALDLAARLFLSAGDTALIENPCYREAHRLFMASGARVVPVEVDAEGFDPENIPAAGERAKLIYVTPSHQYPLGVTMSLTRRLKLLDWAKRRDAWIIEDDYNSEYRYAGRPLASLQGLDKSGRVIYLGTFSKTIFPSLRIGCAVVPSELAEVFTRARALTDVHSPLIEQAILTEFIAGGHFAGHLRRMRKLYEMRQSVLVAECETHLKGLLEVEKAAAGMHLNGWLPAGADGSKIAEKAAANGLKLVPVSDFYNSGKTPREGFVLGYTAFDEQRIKAGVRLLRQILT
jgi:GntR family transcriptional regulator / MocR family aminotransferase